MSKLGEDIKIEDGKLHHVEYFSKDAALNAADHMRKVKEHTGGKLLNFVGESFGEPQYSYPPWLEQLWSQQWGVRMDDPAFEEIVQLELNSGQYERFRI